MDCLPAALVVVVVRLVALYERAALRPFTVCVICSVRILPVCGSVVATWVVVSERVRPLGNTVSCPPVNAEPCP
jgi:hypothetical protein